MATVRSSPENISLLKAIDGNHLRWNIFRDDVLQPFGIKISRGDESIPHPSTLISRLEERHVNLGRFDQQRQKWRDQITAGQCFTSPTLFPPNVLPPSYFSTKLQRFLSPKLSREVLPRRLKSTNCLFELPSSKPMYATGFVTEAFSELEHLSIPSALSPTGTIVDFAKGHVSTGRIFHCPFIVFEYCPSMDKDDIEKTLNMCAISGAQCVRGLQDISVKALKGISSDIFTFSCLINDQIAIISIHTVDEQGRYVMSAMCRFDLAIDEHYNSFQGWIEAIEEWASNHLLPRLKDDLTKITHLGDTPPASPMPSLTLSIDTEIGIVPELMQALRRTYPKTVWRGDLVAESPINSSIAHCGTPAEGRKGRDLSVMTPASANYGGLMMRRGWAGGPLSPTSNRYPQLPYSPTRPSPFSPRFPTALPPLVCETIQESPCRPPTHSPYCTPPPDQPWTAQSPILVLQKRVDVAMNEVQDLRTLVETLQFELDSKNKLLNERLIAMEALQVPQKTESIGSRAESLIVKDEGEEICEIFVENAILCDSEKVTKKRWVNLTFRYEGWESLFEHILLFTVITTLMIMGMMMCSELFVGPSHLQSQLSSAWALMHINCDWLVEKSRLRISRIRTSLHEVNLWKYLGTSQSLD